MAKNMLFKRFFYATLGGTVGAAAVGIALAYNGFGVWALVAQQLFNASVDTLILWITVKWRPKKAFSLMRLKSLFNYGWKLLASALLNTAYIEARQLIIGRAYTSADLAFYNRGRVFPHTIISNIDSSINSVLLPTMSSVQDDAGRVKAMTRRAIKTSTFIMAPLMMGLAFTSGRVVRIILTEKWMPCVPFLCIFCITFMFYPIHTANLNAIQALGRSDLFFRLEIIKTAIGTAVLLCTFRISVMAMAYSMLFTSVTSQLINSWPNWRLLGYNYLEQLKDILPNIVAAVMMGVAILIAGRGLEGMMENVGLAGMASEMAILFLQVIIGAAVYIVLSVLTQNDSFSYVFGLIRSAAKK